MEPGPEATRWSGGGTEAPRASEVVLGFADRHRRFLPPLLGLWFLAFCNGRWRLESDGAVALTVGRSIARGGGFTHPDGLHAPLSQGLPRVAAWGFRLFGDGSVTLPLLAIGACWAAGLALCFLLVRRAAGRPTAVLVTALLGLTEAWTTYAVWVRTDLPFATGVLAVLLGWEWLAPAGGARPRRAAGAALLALGLALCYLTRSVWVIPAVAVALAAAWRAAGGRWRWWLPALPLPVLGAFGLALAASPALRDDAEMLLGRFERDTGGQLRETLTLRLPRLFTESLPEAVFGLDVGPVATALASAVLLTGLFLAVTRPLRPLWLALPLLFAAQWVAFHVHDRYVLPLLPLLLLGWWAAAVRLEAIGFRSRVPLLSPALRWAAPAALVACVGMNAAESVALLKEQRGPAYAEARERRLAAAGRWLREHSPPDAVVLTGLDPSATLAFLADRRVLSGRELEKLADAELPAGPWFFFEPLDGRARRAAGAAGLVAGEPVGPSLLRARRR